MICGVAYDEELEIWKRDAALLAQIGRLFFDQRTEVRVRIPKVLADEAVAAWERTGSEEELPPESPDQRRIRTDASSAALIGESIKETGMAEGGDVVFTVDAWFVGNALTAADDAGLLND
jgi:hypothetical protein